MNRLVVIEKKIGETPLQALEGFRKTRKTLSGVSLTYAGRLDPMAEGKLLILIGDECKKRDRYDKLDKEYRFEVLLGLKSDTGDVLGIAESLNTGKAVSKNEVLAAAKSFVGDLELPYPIFSSKTVEGRPLFEHAHRKTLQDITIPVSRVNVFQLNLLEMHTISRTELFKNIFAKIDTLKPDTSSQKIGSDFRVGAIRLQWEKLRNASQEEYVVLTFRAIVSSGTYIRVLAEHLGEKLGSFGLALSICRTKIGRFAPLFKGRGFWWKSY